MMSSPEKSCSESKSANAGRMRTTAMMTKSVYDHMLLMTDLLLLALVQHLVLPLRDVLPKIHSKTGTFTLTIDSGTEIVSTTTK